MTSACRDSVPGVAMWYGLNGPRSIPGAGEIFLAGLPPVEWVPGLFSWDKAAGAGIDHPHLSSAEVKERTELYPYSSSRHCGLF